MASPSAQLDRTLVQEQAVAVTRDLLAELGSHRALETIGPETHLEKDLGLGSLERVELVARLGAAFGASLPDAVVAEADTLGDLVAAVLRPGKTQGTGRFSAPVISPAARPGPGPLPEALTLLEVIAHRGKADAARPHIHLRLDDGTVKILTFGEIYSAARAMARGLRFRGLQPGQTVAIMLPTSAEFFPSFLGVLLAGGVAVPIYPPLRADRIEEYAERQAAILRSAEARFLITFRQAEGVARLLGPSVPSLAGVLTAARLMQTPEGAADDGPHPARADDLAFLQYTSGSTGAPKGVMLTHSNLLANMRSIAATVAFHERDVAITWLPLYHDMGLIGAWLTPLYFGLPVAIMSPLSFLTHPERWLWAVHRHKGTISAAPNFAFEMCARKVKERDIEGLDLSTWRAVLNGAEPISPRTLDRFCERFARYGFRPEALVPVYGLAEATLCVTAPRLAAAEGAGNGAGAREENAARNGGAAWMVDRVERAAFEREGRAVPAAPDDESALEFVSVGQPIPGCEVRLLDGEGNEVPERVEGRLEFRGPSATRGYYRNPAATQELFNSGATPDSPYPWVDSGDRAYRAGQDYFITGRVKDIIIKAGRNIYPHEAEEAAGTVEGVRRGCVVAFGLTDAEAGTERMVIVAETRGTPDARARSAIAAAVTERVAETVGLPPDVVELVPAGNIPKTSSGKLRRSETRALYLGGKLSGRKLPAWVQVTRLAAVAAGRTTRSWLQRTFDWLYGLYAAVAFAVFLLPTWTAAYFAPTRASASRATQIGTRMFFRMMFIPIRVRGWEHVAAGRPHVFVANHTSFLDVLLFLAIFQFPYRFVSKKEVASWPFIGTFIRRREDFAFERGDRAARLAQAEALERSLREGVSLLIFPEGTFQAAEGVRGFQLGAFKAAQAMNVPVVPVALRGPRQILRDGTRLPRPGAIQVTFCPPLARRRDAPEFAEIIRMRDAARAAIAEHSGEHLL